jgi:hypothetical protein
MHGGTGPGDVPIGLQFDSDMRFDAFFQAATEHFPYDRELIADRR